MPTDTVLVLLYVERDKIQRAIDVLEGGANGTGIKRRGRPPESASELNEVTAPKTRIFTAAQRKRADPEDESVLGDEEKDDSPTSLIAE